MRLRWGSVLPCPGHSRPFRASPPPSLPARRPPRKLSCTCRSPRPGRWESRRTPTLSAIEPRADSTARPP